MLSSFANRNNAAKICNDLGVYFAIGGSCQNEIDYEEIKNLPYYIGSIGTSTAEERRAAYEMTEYYLQCLIHRANGDLEEYQIEYKGLNITGEEPVAYVMHRKDEDDEWHY